MTNRTGRARVRAKTVNAASSVRVGAIAMAEAVAREKGDLREATRLLARECETDGERDLLGKLFEGVQRRLSRDRQRMVDRLFLARSINRAELFTAERLHALWTRTGLEQRVTAGAESTEHGPRFSGAGSSGGNAYGIDRLAEARLEAVDLWKQVLGLCSEAEQQELRRVVLDEPAASLLVLRAALGKVSESL